MLRLNAIVQSSRSICPVPPSLVDAGQSGKHEQSDDQACHFGRGEPTAGSSHRLDSFGSHRFLDVSERSGNEVVQKTVESTAHLGSRIGV